MNSEPFLDRALLEGLTPQWVHVGRRSTQPNVSGYEADGRRFVVKDFRPRPWLIRRVWGRWVLRREWDRLARLDGLAGIPRLLGWIDPDAFVMEWLDAERLPLEKENALEPAVFERLEALVAEMHRRGVSHGDLRRKNILVDRRGQPFLIDFGTAQLRPARRRSVLFERVCEIDRITVLKLKAYYCPQSLTDEARQPLARPPLLLRVGRFLRKKIYRPFKPRQLRRRWQRWTGKG